MSPVSLPLKAESNYIGRKGMFYSFFFIYYGFIFTSSMSSCQVWTLMRTWRSGRRAEIKRRNKYGK